MSYYHWTIDNALAEIDAAKKSGKSTLILHTNNVPYANECAIFKSLKEKGFNVQHGDCTIMVRDLQK